MLVAFANNQVMLADTAITTITTDPIPLGDNDRASAILSVHYIFGGASRLLTYTTQVSNDGVTWVDDGPTGTAATSAPPSINVVANVNGAFMRVKFDLTIGGGLGAACFDLHVVLDHQ